MRRLSPAPKWSAAVLMVAVLALVSLAALAARTLPGRELRRPPLVLDVDLVFLAGLMGILAAVIAGLVVILALLPGGPPVRLPERKKMSPLKLLGGIVLLFVIFSAIRPLTDRLDGQMAEAAATTQEATPDPPAPGRTGSQWGLVALGAALLLIAWSVAAATRREEPAAEPAQPPAPGVASAIDELLADLERSGEPRAVVIGAYARMETALTADGLPRYASEAPHEYLARALGHLRVSRAAVGQLTRLFEIARFSARKVGADMAREAVAALGFVRAELGGKR